MKHCWSQVLEVEGRPTADLLPAAHFLIETGLLYYHCVRRGELCDLLVVSQSKVDTIMHGGHEYILVIMGYATHYPIMKSHV